MSHSPPKQLCFPPVAGQTIRADFEGGALSSDLGALLLRGVDRQIGLTARLAAAIHDKRHQSYIDHPLRDLLAQRIYQIASGRSEERRVGKECRSRWSPEHGEKNERGCVGWVGVVVAG